jgi:transposase
MAPFFGSMNGVPFPRAARIKVKLLFWDRNGFVLYLKRLERGRFQVPAVSERTRHVDMESAQLAMLLDGIDLNARRLVRWNPASNKGIDTDHQV